MKKQVRIKKFIYKLEDERIVMRYVGSEDFKTPTSTAEEIIITQNQKSNYLDENHPDIEKFKNYGLDTSIIKRIIKDLNEIQDDVKFTNQRIKQMLTPSFKSTLFCCCYNSYQSKKFQQMREKLIERSKEYQWSCNPLFHKLFGIYLEIPPMLYPEWIVIRIENKYAVDENTSNSSAIINQSLLSQNDHSETSLIVPLPVIVKKVEKENLQ